MTQRQEFSNSRVSQNWLNMISGITAATMLFTRLPSLSNAFRPKRILSSEMDSISVRFPDATWMAIYGCVARQTCCIWDQQSQGTRFSMFMFVTLSCRKSLSENVFNKTAVFFSSNFRQAKSNAGFRDVCYTDAQAKEQLQVDEVSRIGWVSFRTGVLGFHGESPSSHCQRERKVGQWKTKQLGKDVHVS